MWEERAVLINKGKLFNCYNCSSDDNLRVFKLKEFTQLLEQVFIVCQDLSDYSILM